MNKRPEDFAQLTEKITTELKKVISGQEEVIEQIVIALLTGGHILIEGVPGLGKTLIANALARLFNADFKRIQFTPDLMPSDIVGTTIFHYEKNEFQIKKGPVFTNFLLADEINRAPAKTQSALLEVMQERQVTIDGTKCKLDEPFITIATQNPIELEGTYPLPEAQLDRFMFKVVIGYPEKREEEAILEMFRDGFNSERLELSDLQSVCSHEEFSSFRESLNLVRVDDKIITYITDIVRNSRQASTVVLGASPRASIAILFASRAYAAINGRDFVIPDDVKWAAFPALRHRIVIDAQTEIDGSNADDIISVILEGVEVPR